jgi:hypothetical protein
LLDDKGQSASYSMPNLAQASHLTIPAWGGRLLIAVGAVALGHVVARFNWKTQPEASMNKPFHILLTFMLALSAPSTVLASGLPTHVGQCVPTKIKWIGTRIGLPDSGSAVKFTNGGYQVSYSTVPAIVHSKVGDRVRMCMVSVPKHCPPGDHRGKKYKTTNLRTHKHWTLYDAEHLCGGA